LKDYKNESLYLDKSKHLNKSIDINEKATAGDVLKQESKNKNETNSSLDVTKLYYIIAIPFLIVLLVIILKRKTTKSNTIDVITEKLLKTKMKLTGSRNIKPTNKSGRRG
jgi:hypothetical protein